MSYDIYIGNAELDPVGEDENDITYWSIRVSSVKLPNAPTFPNDEMTGNGNSRHPGYSAWSEWCRETGLYSLFFADDSGLMCEHPGHRALKKEHAEQIEAALKRWQKNHPNAVPGFDEWNINNPDTPTGLYDPMLARLIWLDWWVKWALANCERPCIYNF